ncbi:MAG: DNA-3-methyladenine glycosylase [Myxococcota bacterium]|nr:DNA-3-methyladenine glycosylase [Myxococcota bacterium]
MTEDELGSFRVLPRRFFQRSAPAVAEDLLGRLLLHRDEEGLCGGLIVETEAYDQNDPASHSCHGRTERNQMMFGHGGVAYVYRSYGVHWCFNVSVGRKGFGAAALIRAVKPLTGFTQMTKRRLQSLKNCRPQDLARGPGRLCQAMAIDHTHNGADLLEGPLFLASPLGFKRPASVATPRIGISKAVDIPWRFSIVDSEFVSGKRIRQ